MQFQQLSINCDIYIYIYTCNSPSLPSSWQGQYIKTVFAGGPAELAGMLAGDHVIDVDGEDVRELPHMKVGSLLLTALG